MLAEFSNFFTTVVNLLTLIWDYLQQLLTHTATFLGMIPSFFTVGNYLTGFVWSPIAISMTFVMLVAVVKLFLGREAE